MGDTFKREFSLGQINTGVAYDPNKRLSPGQGTATILVPGNPPVPDIPISPGQSLPGLPPTQTTVTRPSFLSAFLSNLGPSLGASINAPKGSGIAGGFAAGLQGIEQEQEQQSADELRRRQLAQSQQQLQLQIDKENSSEAYRRKQEENLSSLIKSRENPIPKTTKEQYAQDFADAISRGDNAGAQKALANIQALTAAGAAPKAPPSPWGKLSPEMAAIGPPPNPNDVEKYPKGQKDPAFIKDVQDYGQAVTNLKQSNAMKLQMARGQSFALARAQYQQIPVLDKENDNNLTFATPLEIAKNKDRYLPSSQGASLSMKNAVFEDMNGASLNLRKAYQNLDVPFSAVQIAKMTAAMRDDPSGGLLSSTIQNLATAKGKEALTPAQQNVAVAMLQNYENAFALRGVAGFGAASDQLRGAIKATLPGPSSPPDYALKQLDAYDAQRSRLSRGIPNVPIRSGGASSSGIKIIRDANGRITGVE